MKKKLNYNLIIGYAMIALVLLMAVVGLFYTPYPVNEMNVLQKNQPPSFAHLFGTDQFGRDISAASWKVRPPVSLLPFVWYWWELLSVRSKEHLPLTLADGWMQC